MVKVATTTKLRSGTDSMHQVMWLRSLEHLTEKKIRSKLLLSAPALGICLSMMLTGLHKH
jgi:hypothetical protein